MSQPEQAQRGRRRTTTQPMDAPRMLEGRVLDGRYRLERVLNAGGMGIVYEATQVAVGRRVAVKVLKPTLTRDPSLVERFQLEVEMVAGIAHPNVVTLFDSGRDAGGVTYLVMEYIEGKTLRQALRQGDLRLWEILYVFSQVCAALIETHGQQIIHRDLKFDNIMVSRMRDGRIHVKLLDFGVAKLLSREQELTQVGQVTGTPGIIAPELVDGKAPTARSDLYSMGVLMFTTLAGRAPFQGANDLELMRAHKYDELPNLRKLVGARVPEEVVDLASELLLKDPEQRPQTAEDVRRRLDVMAHRLRETAPDATAYIPPRTEGLEEVVESEEALDVHEFGPTSRDEGRAEAGLFAGTMVAPATVVAYLSLVLMVLILALVYMIFERIGPDASGPAVQAQQEVVDYQERYDGPSRE